MRRLVLLEEFPSGFKAGPGDRVISLTPRASYWLDRHRIPYEIPTDFGTEVELERRENDYWAEELSWFDELDGMLQEAIPELRVRGINPTILYGCYLKSFLDNFFIRGRESLALLREGYDSVVLWPAVQSSNWSCDRFDFQMNQGGIYARLWQHICAARGIAYEEKGAPRRASRVVSSPLIGLRDMARGRLAQALSSCRQWQWFMQSCVRKNGTPRRRLTFLLLDTNYDLSQFLNRALHDGHRCLVYRKGGIIDASRVGRCLGFPGEEVGRGEEQAARWTSAAENLFSPTSQIWRWSDSWFDCPMAPLLAGWLKSWVVSELPRLLPMSDQFQQLYDREKVNFVLTPGLMYRHHIAAVAATPRSHETESVLVAHGDGPDDAKAWDLFELFPYQRYFVPNEEFASYFRERSAQYERATAQVHIGSYRWQQYACLARRPRRVIRHWDGKVELCVNRPPLDIPTSRPIVVYVVGIKEVNMRYMNKRTYPEAWYYRLQSVLIRLFNEIPDYSYVIQMVPEQDSEVKRATEMLINDLGSEHLHVSQLPFSYWLPWADRVILDLPSTPLYEVSRAGVPFHLLVHRGLPMRPAALAEFADSVSVFEEPEEAVHAVNNFLRAETVLRPKEPCETGDIVTTLCSLTEEKGVNSPGHTRTALCAEK